MLGIPAARLGRQETPDGAGSAGDARHPCRGRARIFSLTVTRARARDLEINHRFFWIYKHKYFPPPPPPTPPSSSWSGAQDKVTGQPAIFKSELIIAPLK